MLWQVIVVAVVFIAEVDAVVVVSISVDVVANFGISINKFMFVLCLG